MGSTRIHWWSFNTCKDPVFSAFKIKDPTLHLYSWSAWDCNYNNSANFAIFVVFQLSVLLHFYPTENTKTVFQDSCCLKCAPSKYVIPRGASKHCLLLVSAYLMLSHLARRWRGELTSGEVQSTQLQPFSRSFKYVYRPTIHRRLRYR